LITVEGPPKGFRSASRRGKEWEGINRPELLSAPDLIVTFIREGILTVDQADEVKAVLERNRFKIKVQSFLDLL
jgi:uncharacterized protein involved in tellurium resistance